LLESDDDDETTLSVVVEANEGASLVVDIMA
jgi:hypothetical protein